MRESGPPAGSERTAPARADHRPISAPCETGRGDAQELLEDVAGEPGRLRRRLAGVEAARRTAAPARGESLDRKRTTAHGALDADAVDRGGIGDRAVHRALRVVRTIAHLAGESQVSVRALAHALQSRAHEARKLATG
jgi:predicted ATPase with chaperone activity